MQLRMIDFSQMGMGASMVRRLLAKGHRFFMHDPKPAVMASLQSNSVEGAVSLAELDFRKTRPRAIWLMVPAGIVDQALAELVPHLNAGNAVIDDGNSHCQDDTRHARKLAAADHHHVDGGTSGGVAGPVRGYCRMIGGDDDVVKCLEPIFMALTPGAGVAHRTPRRSRVKVNAEKGFLHCGAHGAGHFVKKIHNGIEYGVMAAYAEGRDILYNANIGKSVHTASAETSLLRDPAHYQFEMNLSDIAKVWRRDSVIGSWLLHPTAGALLQDPQLYAYGGRVSNSGKVAGRCRQPSTKRCLRIYSCAALYPRFASRGEAGFANQMLPSMRHESSGYAEKSAKGWT